MLDSEMDLKCIDVCMFAWVSLQRRDVVVQDSLITDTASVMNAKWSGDSKSPLHFAFIVSIRLRKSGENCLRAFFTPE